MNDINSIKERIDEQEKKLAMLSYAYNMLIESAIKSDKHLKKQQEIFDTFRTTKESNSNTKILKQTEKNLKKVNAQKTNIDVIKEKLNTRFKSATPSSISKILDIIDKDYNLNNQLKCLSDEYMQVRNNIRHLNTMITQIENERIQTQQEKQNEYKEPIKTITEQDHYNNRVADNYQMLTRKPKKGLFGLVKGESKTHNKLKAEALYSFAEDVLYVMEKYDQAVWTSNSKAEDIQKSMFQTYGVNSMEQLLDKYGQIREAMFKKFEKLDDEKKQVYTYDGINLSASNNKLPESMPYSFPPSKNELIRIINKKIMTEREYDTVTPKERENEYSKPEALDYGRYVEVVNYYKNLSKNMTIEEISIFYKHVQECISKKYENSKQVNDYSALLQKAFSEVIFSKKGMKRLDALQYDEQLKKIVNEYFNEDYKCSISKDYKVEENVTIERKSTVYNEYIKYYAALKEKKDAISFSQFATQKYGIKNMQEPTELEEELKGIKR